MKTVITCNKKDYDQLPHRIKNAVKAVISVDGKVGLIHFTKENLYDFPGGGIEDGETIAGALIREIKEEAGATVRPLSIQAFEPGKYVTIYKEIPSNIIIERYFSYYFCDVEDEYTNTHQTEHEIETGQKFVFVSIDAAIAANEIHIQKGPHWVDNPTYVLRLLKGL